MTRIGKYCRTLLAGSLVFGGAIAISVVGASLSASPAAAATTPSHSGISLSGSLGSARLFRSAGPLGSKGLLESLLPTTGAPGNAGLGGSLDSPRGAKSDQGGWTVAKSANILSKQGLFDTDSCGSATSCMAVGYYTDKAGVEAPMAEAWNGSKWSVQKLPKTPGDQSGAFWGVSCTSATACTAVGAYADSSGDQVSLAEVFNGTSWSVETTPNPSGAQPVSLEGVSCTSSSKCIAVGGSEDSSGDVTTLVEKRKGTSWSIVASPNPSGAQGSVLDGESCTSSSACTAVGKYIDSSSDEDTLAEVWNGTSWSIESTPNTSGTQTNLLGSVSCTSSGTCSAVGAYVDGSGAEEALAEEWNGSSWSIETIPNPSGAQESTLSAVACTSGGACTAVGGYIDSSGPEMTLSEGWNGTSWSLETTPSPSGALLSTLGGVACSSTGACIAAGYVINSSNVEVTLAEARNGASWSIKTTPNPKGISQESELLSVACTSANACTAVGGSVSEVTTALVEAWNGTKWSIQTTPTPSGAQDSALYAVACTSASACTAVGGYENSSDADETLAEVWNGTSWSIQSTPNPSGAEASALNSVACTAANACTAVGDYTDSSGDEDTLAEVWNGTSWSIESTPSPSGAEASVLKSVACTAANACTAVGDYTDSSGTQDTLAEAWNGTSWSIETTPNPTGDGYDTLSGVSCTSGAPCTAVGAYTDSAGYITTLAEAWDGTSWSIQATPLPLGAPSGNLDGVACTSSGCTAVGDYSSIAGFVLALVEVESA
ncbi:MAG: hypothetical protein WAM97_10255 [Acidimicrobiales bacterium]